MNSNHNISDVLTAIIFAVLGLVTYFVLIPTGVDVPKSTSVRALAPDYWPRLIALAAIVTSCLILLGSTIFKSEKTETNPTETEIIHEEYGLSAKFVRTALLILIFIVFFASIQTFGLVVTSAIVMGTLMIIFGERKFLLVFGLSIATPAVLYLFFRYVAGIPIHLGNFIDWM